MCCLTYLVRAVSFFLFLFYFALCKVTLGVQKGGIQIKCSINVLCSGKRGRHSNSMYVDSDTMLPSDSLPEPSRPMNVQSTDPCGEDA